MRSRFGVLISGNGSTLSAILDCRDLLDVSVVISSSESAYGVVRARRAGVPVEIWPPDLAVKGRRANAEAWMLTILEKYRVGKIFLAGYMKIVSPEFIKKFEGRIFNVHPSLLPKYKGLESFQKAIDAGDKVAGATVHHVVTEVDGGAHVCQREIKIPSHRESIRSHLWLHINEQRLIRESVRKIIWQDRQM